MRRILITGSRTWTDWHTIQLAIQAEALEAPPGGAVVIHGGAAGADSLAGFLAAQEGLPVEIHPADWERNGKRAGYLRNQYMVDLGADVCLAFIHDNSRGASMCARIAAEAGIPVKEFRA